MAWSARLLSYSLRNAQLSSIARIRELTDVLELQKVDLSTYVSPQAHFCILTSLEFDATIPKKISNSPYTVLHSVDSVANISTKELKTPRLHKRVSSTLRVEDGS
jgi:hypothetical protein